MCAEPACGDNVECRACGYFSGRHAACGAASEAVVSFECVECQASRTECASCFKRCGHCYARDMAKVCWACQRGQVHLECAECGEKSDFEHASCVGIHWQGQFEECCHADCTTFICVRCLLELDGGGAGAAVNCHRQGCEAGNEYFCSRHSHRHAGDTGDAGGRD